VRPTSEKTDRNRRAGGAWNFSEISRLNHEMTISAVYNNFNCAEHTYTFYHSTFYFNISHRHTHTHTYLRGRVSKYVTNWYKTENMWHSNLEKPFISRQILYQHWYTCPILYQCVETSGIRCLLTDFSAISALTFQPLRHQRNVCHPVVNRHFPL
jgi:hypothetical protein